MKQYLSYLATAVFLFATAAFASAACVQGDNGSTTQSYTLFAGQTINSGNVSATVVGDNLEVTYTTTDGWTLNEVHLWVGADVADMPSTRKGNPIPGKFPYVSGDIAPATTYTLMVPLSDLDFACPGDDKFYLVGAHASLSKTLDDGSVQSETGWSDGGKISERGNWATLSSLNLTCECGSSPPVAGTCETAFAYYSSADSNVDSCFLDIDEDNDSVGDFNRWGWTVGPLDENTNTTHDVYAGAAKCDTGKGTLVGTLHVDYSNGVATVTFTNNTPYTLDETHVYVGNEILPRDVNGNYTVAPGQYGSVHDGSDLAENATGDVHVVTGLSGAVYVVAHSVTCGIEKED